MVILLLNHVDDKRYAAIRERLKVNVWMGTNEYPWTISKMYEYMVGKCLYTPFSRNNNNNRNRNNNNRGNNRVSMLQCERYSYLGGWAFYNSSKLTLNVTPHHTTADHTRS